MASTDFNKLVADESYGCKRLIRSPLAKCAKLWNNVSRSTKSSDSAMEILRVSLRTPGETRWNATYDSVKRLLEPRVRQRLAHLMDTLKLPQFSKIEMEMLEEYVKFMAPIAIVLDRLQGESQCFLGLLMPTIQQVQKKIGSCSSSLSHCSLLAQALAKAVELRFPHLFTYSVESQVFAAAAACHPKFKLWWVADSHKDFVKEAFLCACKTVASACVVNDEDRCPASRPVASDDFFDFDDQPGTGQVTAMNKVTTECLRFLEEPCSESLETIHQFPSVKYLFRKLNATVPSSAPVERLFSTGSLVCTPHRNKLSDKRFEQLLLLKSNSAV